MAYEDLGELVLSSKAMASLLGVSPKRLARVAASARTRGGYRLRPAVEAFVRHLKARARRGDARAQLAEAMRARLEQRGQVERGELVPSDDVSILMAEHATGFVTMLGGIVGRSSEQAGKPPADVRAWAASEVALVRQEIATFAAVHVRRVNGSGK